MNKSSVVKIVIFSILSISFYESKSQHFSFEDLLILYFSDSAKIHEVCTKNGFLFVDKKINLNEEEIYKFEKSDNSEFIEMLYPIKENQFNIKVHYWFNDKELYRNYKKMIKSSGFKSQESMPYNSDFGASFLRYEKGDITVELVSSSKVQGYKYLVYIHKKDIFY